MINNSNKDTSLYQNNIKRQSNEKKPFYKRHKVVTLLIIMAIVFILFYSYFAFVGGPRANDKHKLKGHWYLDVSESKGLQDNPTLYKSNDEIEFGVYRFYENDYIMDNNRYQVHIEYILNGEGGTSAEMPKGKWKLGLIRKKIHIYNEWYDYSFSNNGKKLVITDHSGFKLVLRKPVPSYMKNVEFFTS